MSRPEWIKCIAAAGGRTACGRNTEPREWLFVNADHARASVAAGTRLQPCKKCLEQLGAKP